LKIALVTGKLASGMLRELVSKLDIPRVEVRVIELPIPVAAMMTSEYLARELPRHSEELRDVDLVIVPGFTTGDLSGVSRLIGKPVVKGVRYLYDIPLMINALLSGVELSPVAPADEVIQLHRAERDRETLSALREEATRQCYFALGREYKVYISPLYPVVAYEIYLDQDTSLEDALARAEKASMDGADIIVLGFPYHRTSISIGRLIEAFRERTSKPIGVDIPVLEGLIEAAEKGADLLMSLTLSKIHSISNASVLKDTAIVLIPEQGPQSIDPLGNLLEAYKAAVDRGIQKVIIDPILNPPLHGLADSIGRYIAARKTFSNTPLLMGVGNVTELIDADSPGVNAVLASIGVEIGVEVYLTTEASVKTRGSVREVRRALDMCVLSKRESRPPKDLSINLLILKDKRRRGVKPRYEGPVINASERVKSRIDPRGIFKIYVDHDSGSIIVEHYRLGELKSDYVIAGRDPYAIMSEITRRGLVSVPEHYFYLGYELSKAYIALKTGKEYVQEEELFQ